MPYIEQQLDTASEEEVVPEGRYDLRCEDCRDYEKDGKKMLIVDVSVVNPPPEIKDAAKIAHFISLAGPDDDEDKKKFKLRFQKRFFHAFGVAHEGGGFNSDDIPGSTASNMLVKQRTLEGEGRVVNTIELPAVPSGAEEPSTGRRKRG